MPRVSVVRAVWLAPFGVLALLAVGVGIIMPMYNNAVANDRATALAVFKEDVVQAIGGTAFAMTATMNGACRCVHVFA